MSLEVCKLCNWLSTPWVHINGHICEDCYANTKRLFTKTDKLSWISVKDRLPENKEIILVIDEYDEMAVCKFDKTEFEYFFMLFNTSHQVIKVTHWMPLPEAPTK